VSRGNANKLGIEENIAEDLDQPPQATRKKLGKVEGSKTHPRKEIGGKNISPRME